MVVCFMNVFTANLREWGLVCVMAFGAASRTLRMVAIICGLNQCLIFKYDRLINE